MRSDGLESPLHQCLAFHIEGAGCLVEEEDIRVSNQSPCNSKTLALASTERQGVATELGMVPLWKTHDEVVDVG